MTLQMSPYLSFEGNAREAMTFYQSVLGGELSLSTFADFGASVDPGEQDQVMHSQLETADGFILMGSDAPADTGQQPGGGASIALSGDDDARLRGFWDRLSDGGQVLVPLEPVPWGGTFGMCLDRFGITWLVNVNSTA